MTNYLFKDQDLFLAMDINHHHQMGVDPLYLEFR